MYTDPMRLGVKSWVGATGAWSDEALRELRIFFDVNARVNVFSRPSFRSASPLKNTGAHRENFALCGFVPLQFVAL
jgi:hypothetical protein